MNFTGTLSSSISFEIVRKQGSNCEYLISPIHDTMAIRDLNWNHLVYHGTVKKEISTHSCQKTMSNS